MSGESIKKISERIFERLFSGLGYARREEGIYTREIDEEFMLWIGTPSSVKGGVRAVSPVVGIRHKKCQDMLAELIGEKPHDYLPPTVSIGLGFLLAEAKWREWYFYLNDTQTSYERFVDFVESHAVPFAQNNANLHALERMLRGFDFVRSKFDQYERLPIVKFLGGDVSGSLETLENFVGLLKANLDPRSVTYCNRYAVNFRRLAERDLKS